MRKLVALYEPASAARWRLVAKSKAFIHRFGSSLNAHMHVHLHLHLHLHVCNGISPVLPVFDWLENYNCLATCQTVPTLSPSGSPILTSGL